MPTDNIETGVPSLDELLGGLRPGDNVVWQVDGLETYVDMARPFAERALAGGRRLIYLRFASHPPILAPTAGLVWIEIDASPGFDAFSAQLHRTIEEQGPGAFYLFDNLSSLAPVWATDEALANFFQVTCPFLRELDTVAYFGLTRGRHSHRVVARIRDTTQVLIDAYRLEGRLYLHPLKVFDRYSAQMFLPHLFAEGELRPIFQSGEASALSRHAGHRPLAGAESIAPWDSVHRRLLRYDPAELSSRAAAPDVVALKQELSRMLLGDHPEFNLLAERYLSLADLLGIRDRVIGSGRIGGKAAGMLVARSILKKTPGEIDFTRVLDDHDSFFIGSDVFFTFLVNNDLFRLRLRLTRGSRLAPEEFEQVEQRFLEGEFPPEIMDQFQDLLDYFGQAPIIVRSSSLLEDSFGNAFAGKYRSEFCPNQGGPEQRMAAFLNAVRLVYASSVNPDALSYRRRRGLGESDEQMAILVQRVSGAAYQNYFFPPLAGVAFSRNLYRWSDRIDPTQGMLRLVFGLGTRAVNRVGDYPRMIAVSHPELRPEAGPEIAAYSQRTIDLLDLADNALVALPLAKVTGGRDYPNLPLFVSTLEDGYPTDPVSLDGGPERELVFTFNNLIKRTDFVKIMRELLARLEKAYRYPIDTEFTAFIDAGGAIKINLLQCRPMRLPGTADPAAMPANLAPEQILFRTNRSISGGVVPNLKYLIYVDPDVYAEQTPLEIKRSLGRVVGRINRHPRLAGARFALLGPGRWGSSNIFLGINASYADLNHAAVLVEIAREQTGQTPELSYGAHFFQDLVEANIIYLPVYPADPESRFNRDFFAQAPNLLATLLPEDKKFEPFIKVIDVPAAAAGRFAQVVADPRAYQAVCFLAEEKGE